jgi:mRNA interferase RelE/StbE
MDKIDKALLKLTSKQRSQLLEKFQLICAGQTKGLDVKKMKGSSDLYRLRVGRIRLIYKHEENSLPIVVFIGMRDDKTYKDF